MSRDLPKKILGVTGNLEEPGGGLANTREGQMGLLPCDVKAVLNTARQVLGAIVRALDHGALSMNPATLAPDIRQAYARIEVVAAQENLFQNRLDTIHSCLKGRYPFITTIESGLDAAAWEREELRDALVTLREAISDFKGHGMPGFTDRAAAYLALSKADGAISSSRFALQRHLTENGGEQGASLLSQTSATVREQMDGKAEPIFGEHIKEAVAAFRPLFRKKERMDDPKEWLLSGGGGFEDGEDGLRAASFSGAGLIEIFEAYREYLFSLPSGIVEQPEKDSGERGDAI